MSACLIIDIHVTQRDIPCCGVNGQGCLAGTGEGNVMHDDIAHPRIAAAANRDRAVAEIRLAAKSGGSGIAVPAALQGQVVVLERIKITCESA